MSIYDCVYISNRVRSSIINNDNVLDLSHTKVDTTQNTSVVSITIRAGIKNKRIISTEKNLKLDDKVAMALLNTICVVNYLSSKNYSCVFVTVLLFVLPYNLLQQMTFHFLRLCCIHTCILIDTILIITMSIRRVIGLCTLFRIIRSQNPKLFYCQTT